MREGGVDEVVRSVLKDIGEERLVDDRWSEAIGSHSGHL